MGKHQEDIVWREVKYRSELTRGNFENLAVESANHVGDALDNRASHGFLFIGRKSIGDDAPHPHTKISKGPSHYGLWSKKKNEMRKIQSNF